MKKIFKQFLVIALIFSLTLSGTLTAFGASSNGIKVQYNGKNISFTDAAAKTVDGRTMVPFRQVLETMGATVTYDEKTKTINAKTKDKDISFVVGGKDINVTENGNKVVKKMDVAPFVDNSVGRTYIPVRFIAESLGYNVGWDATEKTVVIINPETIFANVDKDFSIVSKLMSSDLDYEKAYETKGKFSADVTAYQAAGAASNMNFSLSGDMSGVQQKLDVDMVMTLAFNMDKMLSTMSATEKAQIQPMLDMFKNANMSVKMDGETGNTYMQSNIFSVADPKLDKNTWYKMNIYDVYNKMGIDLKSLVNLKGAKGNNAQLIKSLLSTMDCSDVSAYQDIKATYTILKNLVGDSAFKKSTSGGIDTYTLDLNQTSIVAALAKSALDEGVSKDSLDLTEIGDLLKKSNFSGNITIQEKSGTLYGYQMKCSGAAEGNTFAVNMTGDQKNANVDMTIDAKDVMKMIVKVDSQVTETTKKPNVDLPSGAKVVDFPF